ncbi:response regulator [Deminuibacter soli]|nr:response regulator [Deminuibacter soli]
MKKQELACIIDDDLIYLYNMQKLLALHSINNVLVFHNGEEAMQYFTETGFATACMPDIILLDINMPVMNGWEFLDAFKEARPLIQKDITIYMVSSSVDKDDMKRAKSYEEVADYFVKPVTLANLEKILSVLS